VVCVWKTDKWLFHIIPIRKYFPIALGRGFPIYKKGRKFIKGFLGIIEMNIVYFTLHSHYLKCSTVSNFAILAGKTSISPKVGKYPLYS
jgi:hypothetical protein